MGSNRTIRSFEELEVWKACRDVRLFVANVVKQLPEEEKYRLRDQMIRASRSTTANVAEGYGRFHYQENIQFCRQARGSLYELLDHMITGHDEGLFSEKDVGVGRQLLEKAIALCNGYIAYLKKAKNACTNNE